MIWTNPWAWFGLAALAVPVLIHLLARETFEAVPFSTLRFLRASSHVDVRRKRLSDIALLAVRCAILALAVAALAQPFMTSRGASEPLRLVVIDASPSVDIDAARAAARGYGGNAIERESLTDGVHEAAGWAAQSSSPVTVVVVSDFQRGALDPATLRRLPANAAITVHRVARREIAPTLQGVSSVSFQGVHTRASWPADVAIDDAVRVASAHGGDVERAMIEAARATAAAHGRALRPVTFVLGDAPGRAALVEASAPADAPWMFDVMAAISPGRAQTVRTADGRALVFLSTADPAAATDAMREAIPALVSGPPLEELEPLTLPDGELRDMERPAAAGTVRRPEAWAGRWLWLAALVLLGLETWMRRGRRVETEALARAA